MQKHAAASVCFRFSTELRADDIKYFFFKVFSTCPGIDFFYQALSNHLKGSRKALTLQNGVEAVNTHY